MNKNIDDRTGEQFMERTCCVVNPTVKDKFGGIRGKTNREKHWDAKKGQRMATDNRIRAMYDHTLSPGKNAEMIGCSVNSVKKYAPEVKETEEVDEIEEWISEVLEENASELESAPAPTRKKSFLEEEEERELNELLKDLDLDMQDGRIMLSCLMSFM